MSYAGPATYVLSYPFFFCFCRLTHKHGPSTPGLRNTDSFLILPGNCYDLGELALEIDTRSHRLVPMKRTKQHQWSKQICLGLQVPYAYYQVTYLPSTQRKGDLIWCAQRNAVCSTECWDMFVGELGLSIAKTIGDRAASRSRSGKVDGRGGGGT